jgi:hypothetical protein
MISQFKYVQIAFIHEHNVSVHINSSKTNKKASIVSGR